MRTRWTWIGGMALIALMADSLQAALLSTPQKEERHAPTLAAATDGLLRHWPAPNLQPRVDEAREAVAPGQEAIWLAARLVQGGGLIRRPVSWELQTRSGTRKLFSPQAEIPLRPGHYELHVRYGQRTVQYAFELRQGERLKLIFVLNVGGLRALALLEGLRQTFLHDVRVEHRIIQHRPGGGSRVWAATARQGQIIRLPAGHYVLESRFHPGNAKVVTPVRIKPGRLHGYEIAARAALLHMQTAGQWTIRAMDGNWTASGRGKRTLVLAPGKYEILAGKQWQWLELKAGENRRWPAAAQEN